MPEISVIMPVYNSSPFLAEAIDSILSQSFTDFELLIFNDGSTDSSREIILAYQDPRIVFFDSGENIGYTKRLNMGLRAARGKYIARMDSDDVALPQRFEKQHQFLNTYKDVVLCGTFFEFTGIKDQVRNFNWVSQTDPEMVKINLLFDCAICHPTVMFVRESLITNGIYYNEAIEPSEDYALWVALAQKFQLANLPERLLAYRIGDHQVSNQSNTRQRHNKFELIRQQLSLLGIIPNDTELRIHDQMFYGNAIFAADYMPKLIAWAKKLIRANITAGVYDQQKLQAYLADLIELNAASLREIFHGAALKDKIRFLAKKTIGWHSIK